VLVQPATVGRWHREGFRGCWRRRSRRRPGRPRIDLQLRSLIARMATENHLWGAPRIHGELLKLGFTVSERTVSRYLPHRLATPSQTWRTFLANHIGSLAFTSTVTSSLATSDDDVNASVLRCRPVPPSGGHYASTRWEFVPWPPSRQSTSLGWCVVQDQLHSRTRIRCSSGKDPPKSFVEPVPAAYGWRFHTSRDSVSPEGADQQFETQSLGRSVRQSGLHIAGEPTTPSLQALKRTSTSSDSRNIGETHLQFADDALITPPRVISRETDNQRSDLTADWRAPGSTCTAASMSSRKKTQCRDVEADRQQSHLPIAQQTRPDNHQERDNRSKRIRSLGFVMTRASVYRTYWRPYG